ncbi:hypothetical protein Nepgr_008024 [Nepenthes gracilis]|uniref:Uncharacterized protein n=1 Tax=Nepenthes gracilis TaxID=150966 RepID=A0AAD3S860_NEPGR|nr:hypothetical protein Nepgr_008024 [Nepenthes gracilis]
MPPNKWIRIPFETTFLCVLSRSHGSSAGPFSGPRIFESANVASSFDNPGWMWALKLWMIFFADYLGEILTRYASKLGLVLWAPLTSLIELGAVESTHRARPLCGDPDMGPEDSRREIVLPRILESGLIHALPLSRPNRSLINDAHEPSCSEGLSMMVIQCCPEPGALGLWGCLAYDVDHVLFISSLVLWLLGGVECERSLLAVHTLALLMRILSRVYIECFEADATALFGTALDCNDELLADLMIFGCSLKIGRADIAGCIFGYPQPIRISRSWFARLDIGR